MRTSCQNADISDVENERKSIIDTLVAIEEKGKYTKAPAIVYKEVSPLIKAVRDLCDKDCTIVINDKNE